MAETIGFTQVLEALRPHYEAYLADADAFNGSPCLPVSLSTFRTNLPICQSTHRRGVGLAGMWYRFGKSGTLRIEAHAELAQDGHFMIYCTVADYGQGMNTVVSQMAAEALGVPRTRIEMVNGDTPASPTAHPGRIASHLFRRRGGDRGSAGAEATRSWAWPPSSWIATRRLLRLAEDWLTAPVAVVSA